MAWYITQSLLIVAATFVLGLIVGRLWWGRTWRRVPFGESAAIRVVRDRFQAALAERDAEITRLDQKLHTAELSLITVQAAAGTPGTDGGTGAGEGPDGDAEPDRRTVSGNPTAGPEQVPGTDPDSDEPQPVGSAEPDDLQRIEGVGPRIAAALEGAGLRTFHAIAQADAGQLSAALREAGLSFAPSLVSWPLQARLLAAGEEETFAALKAELTAGRARPTRGARPGEPSASSDDGTDDDDQAATVVGTVTLGPHSGSLPVLAQSGDTDTAVPTPTAGAEHVAHGDAQDGGAQNKDEQDEDDRDELERVEGIGPRIAAALRKAGIHTYHQLAVADAPTLQAALTASGLRFTPSLPTWSRQAALLADGDEAGFLELARTLVPERETGRPSS